jgi:hypothetical protein
MLPNMNSENITENDEQTEPPVISVRRKTKTGRKSGLEYLDDATYSRMLLYIRSGAYDWVAAAALGITPETFYRWLRIGEKKRTGPYRNFYLDVLQARGEARMIAEVKVKQENPYSWLRSGPGRTKPGLPGWTEEVVIHHEGGENAVQVNHNILPVSLDTLGEAFQVLDQLDLIKLTDHGKETFKDAQNTIDEAQEQEDE